MRAVFPQSSFSVAPMFAVISRWLQLMPHGEVKPVSHSYHPSLGPQPVLSSHFLHSVFCTQLPFNISNSVIPLLRAFKACRCPHNNASSFTQHFRAFPSLSPAQLCPSFLILTTQSYTLHVLCLCIMPFLPLSEFQLSPAPQGPAFPGTSSPIVPGGGHCPAPDSSGLIIPLCVALPPSCAVLYSCHVCLCQ